MKVNSRRIAISLAALSLAGLLSACGVGQAVDCNAAATDAAKIMNEWTGSITKNAADPKAMETASAEAATKSKELAGKYDGELAAALNDMASGFENVKMDDVASMTEFTTKLQGFSTKIQSACS